MMNYIKTALRANEMHRAANAEIVATVRETAKLITGGNCLFADDDVLLLGRLAKRAIAAGLIEGFDHQTNVNLERKRDEFAQAIEARRAETQSGSVHESAVPKGCAHD